jgi:hypothetical protein
MSNKGNHCKDAYALAMATPLQQGHQCQLNNSEDACASMTATTPLLRGKNASPITMLA